MDDKETSITLSHFSGSIPVDAEIAGALEAQRRGDNVTFSRIVRERSERALKALDAEVLKQIR